MKRTLLFTGSYSRRLVLGTGEIVPGTGKGIEVFDFNKETGELTKLHEYPEEPNPTFLCVDKTKQYLYANHELKMFKGIECGGISAFKIDVDTGALCKLNSRIAGGTDAAHVNVTPDNRFVLTANYMSGSTTVYPRNEDGSVGMFTCFMQHKGSSADEHRQKGPHAHQITFDPTGKRVLVPDLGADEIVIYDFDYDKGYIIPAKVEYPKVAPGHGPRHCVFGPKGDRLYLINEMGNTIYVYSYDCETAETKELQVLETVPSDWPEWTTTAAIKIHPNGKILYGSNRGHDSLVTCRIDEETGMLTLLDIQPVYGHFPRDFDIDSTGKWLIAGGQYTDNLVVFSINEEDGALTKVHEVKGVDAVTGVLLVDFE